MTAGGGGGGQQLFSVSLTQSFTQLSLENFLALSGCFSRLLLARGRKVGIANEVPLSRLLVKSFSPLVPL